ncbi:DEAD/DEAH box helicase [Curvibacter sp. APW13]|uniref:DEAD/DEAH box helicase n=1 Tax=Curvibacter sp. APW13 TaxID=3077236 RepID=UPI0028DE3B1F|nr:DEAD/DEAH box helicase [Curvibacter sp. APW13]MDT8990643.1 DEAD/DEAH box helicase [Curvibacter sp. APW13]
MTWQRALALFRQQAVLDLEIEAEGGHWLLLGEVQGTQREPYETSTALVLDDGAVQHWEGRCSCAVGRNCKHAAALAIKAAYQGRAIVGNDTLLAGPEALQAAKAQAQSEAASQAQRLMDAKLLGWLDQLQLLQAAEDAAPAEVEPEQLVYLLTVLGAGGPAPMLQLEAGLSHRKRHGGWARVKPLRSQPLAGHALYERSSPADRDVLQLLRAQHVPGRLGGHGASFSPSVLPMGQGGLVLLQQAARTGRLFLDDGTGQPDAQVQWGTARTLHWQWQEVRSPSAPEPLWQLRGKLSEASTRLCLNDPPMYLDTALALCGPVLADGLDPSATATLLRAPAVSQASLERQQSAVVAALGSIALPPVLHSQGTLKGIAPVPCLHLAANRPDDIPALGLVRAVLSFDYAGHRGWWAGQGSTVVVEDAQGRWLLQRNAEAEFDAMGALLDLGLHTDGSGMFHLLGAQPQQRWLEWADTDFDRLRNTGFRITLDDSLAHWITRADALHVHLSAPEGDNAQASPWFDLSLGMDIGGERQNVLPWLPDLIAAAARAPRDAATGAPQLPAFIYLPQHNGHGFVRLPTAPLQPWMAALLELVGERPKAFSGDALKLSRLDALRTAASLGEGAVWDGAQALRDTVQALRGQRALPEVAVPASVQARLRPYQQQGLNWLQFLRAAGLGGILADDMGLGKTLQTLAHIQVEKDAGRLDRPALIVAPVSLMGNWQREAARFCPTLRCIVVHGAERHNSGQLADFDVVIAPYSLLKRDEERWRAQPWHLLVLDEAQNIKNASTHAAQVVSSLEARHRLCLSGTPMENHLGELWSLFHFLMPGFLGSQARFTQLFRTPIEKQGDSERMAQLRARITPFMLRRTKALVADELPPKVETVLRVELQGAQADLYETIRLGMEKTVREALVNKGLAKSHITILDALMKLRQVCCDPSLLDLEAARAVHESAKLDQLMAMLPEMVDEGRRVLVFSQFTSMLALIEARLKDAGLRWTKLTGQTQKRDDAIAQFTSGSVPIFLISLKAGGVGLNLPQADTVIHFDPWWNPAAEAQATDRAHRIGQTQSVFVYKLVAQGTIEERILALQERKAELGSSLYREAATRKEAMFSETDLAELLKPLE